MGRILRVKIYYSPLRSPIRSVVFCRVCFVNTSNKIKRRVGLVNSSLTIYRPIAGGGAGGALEPPPEFLEDKKNYN